MRIEFSGHALSRFILRGISKKSIETILDNIKICYYDIETRNFVTFGKTMHKGKVRSMAVVYNESFGHLTVITAHPISAAQVQNRILRGRWIKV